MFELRALAVKGQWKTCSLQDLCRKAHGRVARQRFKRTKSVRNANAQLDLVRLVFSSSRSLQAQLMLAT